MTQAQRIEAAALGSATRKRSISGFVPCGSDAWMRIYEALTEVDYWAFTQADETTQRTFLLLVAAALKGAS